MRQTETGGGKREVFAGTTCNQLLWFAPTLALFWTQSVAAAAAGALTLILWEQFRSFTGKIKHSLIQRSQSGKRRKGDFSIIYTRQSLYCTNELFTQQSDTESKYLHSEKKQSSVKAQSKPHVDGAYTSLCQPPKVRLIFSDSLCDCFFIMWHCYYSVTWQVLQSQSVPSGNSFQKWLQLSGIQFPNDSSYQKLLQVTLSWWNTYRLTCSTNTLKDTCLVESFRPKTTHHPALLGSFDCKEAGVLVRLHKLNTM